MNNYISHVFMVNTCSFTKYRLLIKLLKRMMATVLTQDEKFALVSEI